MKTKKIPIRTCLGCGEPKEKRDLIRVVRSPEGELSIDLTGKKSGRGAYICKSEACLKKAVKSKRIQNNLEVSLSDELIDALTKELNGEGK